MMHNDRQVNFKFFIETNIYEKGMQNEIAKENKKLKLSL